MSSRDSCNPPSTSEERLLPLVTVVTATFNASRHLSDCVASVLNQQTLGEIEIEHVLVDGGSTDGTVEFIRSLFEKGYRGRWISEKDEGIYDAMNKGARMAGGCVLNFLNADDRYHDPLAVYRSVKPILEGKADYSYGEAVLLDGEGRSEGSWPPSRDFLYLNQPYSHQTLFVRKDLFLKCGGHDQRYRISADDDLMWKLEAVSARGIDVGDATIVGTTGGVSYQRYWRHETAAVATKHADRIKRLMREDSEYAARVAYFLYKRGRFFPAWAPRRHRQRAALEQLKLMKKLDGTWRRGDMLLLRLLEAAMLRPAARGRAMGRTSWRFLLCTLATKAMGIRYRLRYGKRLILS